MITIDIEETELFDEKKQEFYKVKKQTLQLEHSLISVSKWESIWKKSFFSKEGMTPEETLSYVHCMVLNPKVDISTIMCIKEEDLKSIVEYIKDNKTATFFSNREQQHSREIITSELIYYWMIQAQIPFECEKWHISRLLTLIEVCSRKNAPPKKMSKKDLMNRNRALNAQRRARTGSRG